MQTQNFGRALSRSALAGLAAVVAVVVSAGVVAAVTSGSPAARRPCAATSCPAAAPTTSRQTVAPRSTTTQKASGTAKRAPALPPKAPLAPKWQTALPSVHLAAPIVATTSGFAGKGLFMVASDGGVFPVGEAGFYGSVAGQRLFGPITAAAADPTTGGYWLAGADGGVFAFNAPYLRGVSSHRLFAPIVAMASTPDGRGYWLVGADGGIFTFGDALFYGSVSSHRLFAPIVAMASTPDGRGYWLVGRDGGVFPFGDAPFLGSAARTSTSASVRAIVATPSGRGYWLTGAVGGVFSFGDAPAVADTIPKEPSVSITSLRKARTIVHSEVVRYASGSSGYDLSQYQCGQIPPSRQRIAVVQVSGGYLDSPPNPCYVQEAKWAGPNMSSYIYLDGLPSPTPASAYQGPRGACSANDIPCQSYNYGYNWTLHWIAYSRSVGIDPKLWWLDVERYSGWNGVLSNDLVITGALDALRHERLQAGIYSSSDQWSEIAGNLPLPGYSLWVPGAGNRVGPGYTASSFCHSGGYAFAGGHVKVVQFGYQGPFPGTYTGPAIPYDRDYAC